MTSSAKLSTYLSSFSTECLQIIGPLAKSVDISEPVIFIDGGVRHRQDLIGFSFGDGDSSSKEEMDILLPTDKDQSDLEAFFNQLPVLFNYYDLKGFSGERKDHDLANLLVAYLFAVKHGDDPCRIDLGHDKLILNRNSIELNHQGNFSLFTFSDNQVCTVHGDCHYTGKVNLKPFSSHGLSNYSNGSFQIDASQSTLLIVLA